MRSSGREATNHIPERIQNRVGQNPARYICSFLPEFECIDSCWNDTWQLGPAGKKRHVVQFHVSYTNFKKILYVSKKNERNIIWLTGIRELRNDVAHNVVELIQHHLHPSALQLANESPSEAGK